MRNVKSATTLTSINFSWNWKNLCSCLAVYRFLPKKMSREKLKTTCHIWNVFFWEQQPYGQSHSLSISIAKSIVFCIAHRRSREQLNLDSKEGTMSFGVTLHCSDILLKSDVPHLRNKKYRSRNNTIISRPRSTPSRGRHKYMPRLKPDILSTKRLLLMWFQINYGVMMSSLIISIDVVCVSQTKLL